MLIKKHGIKAAIFDLDGVILDSLNVWSDIDVKFLAKRGFLVPDDYVKKIVSLSFEEIADYTIECFKLNETREEVMEEWIEMAEYEYANNICIKPYVAEYLLYIKSLGLKISTATNLPRKLSEPALKNNGIYELFDLFSDISQVNMNKSNPHLFHHVAKILGENEKDIIVFEDVPLNILGAKKAGMLACGVYDSHSLHYQEELKNSSDYYIKSFKDLLP